MHVNVELVAMQSILWVVIQKRNVRRQLIGAEKQSTNTDLSTPGVKYLDWKYFFKKN